MRERLSQVAPPIPDTLRDFASATKPAPRLLGRVNAMLKANREFAPPSRGRSREAVGHARYLERSTPEAGPLRSSRAFLHWPHAVGCEAGHLRPTRRGQAA